MAVLTIPNTFVNGTPADATLVNANFSAVAAQTNNINSANIGALGIYASQLIPTSAAQATFGGTLGYTFLAPAVGVTPLTISGVTSQSVDLFDVALTSGGTKALFVNSGGGVGIGSGGLSLGVGQLGVSSSVNGGIVTLGGTGSSGAWDYGVTTGTTHTWAVAGTPRLTLNATNLSTTGVLSAATLSINGGVTTVTGQMSAASSASSGVVVLGSVAATAGLMDYGATTAGKWSFQANLSAPAYAPVNGGAYTNASDAAFKSNILPLVHGRAEILALKPSSFTVKNTNAPGLGFIAQEVQSVLPELVSADGNGMLGVCYDGVIPVLVKAFQEFHAEFAAYVAAHP